MIVVLSDEGLVGGETVFKREGKASEWRGSLEGAPSQRAARVFARVAAGGAASEWRVRARYGAGGPSCVCTAPTTAIDYRAKAVSPNTEPC